ncbi:MAG: phosphate ABC transporter permease subunit PstC [Candidatus Marinimicrobia bacterium]|nr:phosphate ABC transporter permease subunit PstC [Candidatus Neomarinimicrobiota bacterium]MBO03038.1 phosphate ABC transporter permease subunit PstC [Candidatus Neomarinimicrobiota bacterium]|tara:strand:- start:24980 stop:25927 length:948 start_codon:yes stop_codon:yes gene_type:complete
MLIWIGPKKKSNGINEDYFKFFFRLSSWITIGITFAIIASLSYETIKFFTLIDPREFFFNTTWSPQTAFRADSVGSSGEFGLIPLLWGTFFITTIAMCIAGPLGLLCAILTAEYLKPKVRIIVKPLLEVLAGIPTVVYGFFAAIVLGPWLRQTGVTLGLDVSTESALAAGLVMGIMIIPLISSITDDVLTAVPSAMRDGARGVGATREETILSVVLPAALPGVVAGFIMAISRAVGETMIVVMAAGLAANLTINPLEAVTTVTVQIVTLLIGDQEFESAKTLSAFALAFTLFTVTFILNWIAYRNYKNAVNRLRQ